MPQTVKGQNQKDSRAARRRAAKRRDWRETNLSRHVGHVSRLAAATDFDGGVRWPTDIAEMADRIAKEGERNVPNRDRDLVAKNLPVGSLTPRDGISVWPDVIYGDGGR